MTLDAQCWPGWGRKATRYRSILIRLSAPGPETHFFAYAPLFETGRLAFTMPDGAPRPDRTDLAAQPPRRRALPRRLASSAYTEPDFAQIAKAIARGASFADTWRGYAARVPAPLGYQAFVRRYARWNAANTQSKPHVAIGIPAYSATEDAAAERYWADKNDPSSSVHVIAGFGSSLKVEHGRLVSFDAGLVKKLDPATHRLTAIVFLGAGGLLTIDAIKWCTAQGISIYVLGWEGELISVTAPACPERLELRRAQFAADRLAMAKAVLRQKLLGSSRVGRLSVDSLRTFGPQIEVVDSIEQLLRLEANAASEYWGQCAFQVKHHARGWPEAWSFFKGRGSAISGGGRHATHPVNAILNYAYSITAAQAARLLAAAGLDPCAGFLHTDSRGRYSLAYDVMEMLRPELNAKILVWVGSQTWRRADFPVTPSGIVRLQPTLARVVAQHTAAALPPARIQVAIEWLIKAIRTARAAKP